jgi:epoxyqueuosine reductase
VDRFALLQEIAGRYGCAGFGVTDATGFSGVAATLQERRSSGLAGELGFTYKDPEVAADVGRSFSWAQRLVVVSWPYVPAAGNPGPAQVGTGRVARFASSDHYLGLRNALDRIAAELRQRGYRAEILADDDRLVDRAAAVRAGIGWWGKSTMVLDPRYGPWLLLGTVVTDADLPTTAPMVRDCGTCDACIPACPTGAIVAPGLLDASRCIAHWTQTGGIIPVEFRKAMADRVYGCDDCLDACPPGSKRVAEAATGRGRLNLIELLATDDTGLRERYEHFYLPRRNPRFLRRNALVALGNSVVVGAGKPAGRDQVIAILAGYLGLPDELYRIHAGWALGRIGGPEATSLLDYQLQRERVQVVADELAAALVEADAATA